MLFFVSGMSWNTLSHVWYHITFTETLILTSVGSPIPRNNTTYFNLPILISCAGAKYKDQCPVEDKIPIYLIVAGAVGVFRNLISLGQRAKQSDQEEGEEKKKRPLESILDCFLFVWFICGNVWIYQNYKHVDYEDPSDSHYCHKTLYLFAFWVTTSTYILVGVMCCCVCCVGICAAAFGNEWFKWVKKLLELTCTVFYFFPLNVSIIFWDM